MEQASATWIVNKGEEKYDYCSLLREYGMWLVTEAENILEKVRKKLFCVWKGDTFELENVTALSDVAFMASLYVLIYR